MIKSIQYELKPQIHLFLNKASLVIYCVSCEKQIYDIYQTYSTSKQKQILLSNSIFPNPFKVRSIFMKQSNQQQNALFSSNLQYPQSFQKQKKNCSIFISRYRNTFLQTALRFIIFIPTLSAIALRINIDKIKSPTLKQIIKFTVTSNSGKYRALKIYEIENEFFKQFPQFLLYEKRNPIDIIFTFFKLLQKQLGWKDKHCQHGEIIKPKLSNYDNAQGNTQNNSNQLQQQNEDKQKTGLNNKQKTQWDPKKVLHRYSPLKQMLFSKSTTVEICLNCQHQSILSTNNFECLRLQLSSSPILNYSNLGLNNNSNRKTIQLNALKAIQQSFQMGSLKENQSNIHQKNSKSKRKCLKCEQRSQFEIQTSIEPGNYLMFQIASANQNIKLPRQFDLDQLNHKKCVVNQKSQSKYQFIAGIYRDNQQKQNQKFATVVYHIQNKKFIHFNQKAILQSDQLSANLEKRYIVLIYKRKTNEKMIPMIKNVKSTLYLQQTGDLQIFNPIPLPDFFDVYLTEHHKLPPMMNPFICHHYNLNVFINQTTKCTKINYIPLQIYNFLVEQIGGRKISQSNGQNFYYFDQQCGICHKAISVHNQIKQIQKQIMKYLDNFTFKKGKVLVYKPWLDHWKSYLYEKSKQNYNMWGNSPPLTIDNYSGMKDKNPKTIDQTKYTRIHIEVWMALVTFHGGGPQISLKKIAPSTLIKNYISLRFQQVKSLYAELIKGLSVQGISMIHYYQGKTNMEKITQSQEAIQQEDDDDSSGSSDQEEQQNLQSLRNSNSRGKSAQKHKSSPKTKFVPNLKPHLKQKLSSKSFSSQKAVNKLKSLSKEKR